LCANSAQSTIQRWHMGWYLRKSFGVGPLRLNLSKSGIGYSLGVRGARIGVGPRGSYVRLGRGGVYYQKYLSTDSSRTARPSGFPRTANIEELGTPVLTAPASQLCDSTSDSLLQEIRQKHRKIRLAPLFAVFSGLLIFGLLSARISVGVVIATAAISVWVHVVLVRRDWEQKLVVINYDFDASARSRYVQFLNAVQTFASSGRIWRVGSVRSGVNRKYHAGANALLERKVTSLGLAAPFGFQTTVAVWSMRLGNQTFYFFPDRILVFEGSDVGSISYESVSVSVGQTQFVEEDDVPSDAQVVGSTWRYVNKNGSPDRRFNNNRQFPVVLYSQINISTAAGLNVALESSNLTKAAAFKVGLSDYVNTQLTSENHKQ
jgi:Protein of unknown function (DUF4236)